MQSTRQRIDGTNQHRHNARHFSRFELKMDETIVFREANYLSWGLLINENYDIPPGYSRRTNAFLST